MIQFRRVLAGPEMLIENALARNRVSQGAAQIRVLVQDGPGRAERAAQRTLFLAHCIGKIQGQVGGQVFVTRIARDGELLWKFPVGGRVISGPVTYSLGGKQYVVVAAVNSLFVFALK